MALITKEIERILRKYEKEIRTKKEFDFPKIILSEDIIPKMENFIPRITKDFEYKNKKSPETMRMPYHEGFVFVVPGVTRSICTVGPSTGEVIFRVRTTDKEPDRDLIRMMQDSGLKVNLESSYETSSEYPSINVRLFLEKNPGSRKENVGYYEIYASGVPKEKIIEAMNNVDLIGKILIQVKELQQSQTWDSGTLTEILRKRKFPLAREPNETIAAKARSVVSDLSRKLMANPGLLQTLSAPFLEVGDLVDIAYENKKLQDELRQVVKETIGWQMTQNAGRMTVMDYMPILERVCDALGIPDLGQQN